MRLIATCISSLFGHSAMNIMLGESRYQNNVMQMSVGPLKLFKILSCSHVLTDSRTFGPRRPTVPERFLSIRRPIRAFAPSSRRGSPGSPPGLRRTPGAAGGSPAIPRSFFAGPAETKSASGGPPRRHGER